MSKSRIAFDGCLMDELIINKFMELNSCLLHLLLKVLILLRSGFARPGIRADIKHAFLTNAVDFCFLLKHITLTKNLQSTDTHLQYSWEKKKRKRN